MKRFKYSVIAGFAVGFISCCILYYQNKNFDSVIVMFPVISVLLAAIFYFKNTFNDASRSFSFKVNSKDVIFTTMANHYVNGISIGGRLYLLADKLIFQTNIINFSARHETIIFLKDIKSIEFKRTYGLLDNDFIINTENHSENFMSYKREQWKEEIVKLTS